jgi:nucleoside-diphosphate-sugar epimerase
LEESVAEIEVLSSHFHAILLPFTDPGSLDETLKSIKKRYPNFEMVYEPEPIKQAIADSWPDKMDDSCARNEWGWNPQYDLEKMTDDMILNLKKKLL